MDDQQERWSRLLLLVGSDRAERLGHWCSLPRRMVEHAMAASSSLRAASPNLTNCRQ
jgi:hypothetical protein